MPLEPNSSQGGTLEAPPSDSQPSLTPPPSTEPSPTGNTRATLRGAGLRYGDADTVPDWARGKTADEIVDMADRMFQYMQQSGGNSHPQPQPQYAPQQPRVDAYSNGGYSVQEPNPDLMYTDARAYQQQLTAYQQSLVQQQLSAVAAPILSQNAEMARELSRRDPEISDVWSRYAPEIEVELAGIPVYQRNKSLYDKAAEIVRGRHWRDFAREEAERLSASGSVTERVGTGYGPSNFAPHRDSLDEFFDSAHPYVEFARSQGVTKEMVRKQVEGMGTTVEDWVKGAKSGQVISATGNRLQRSF